MGNRIIDDTVTFYSGLFINEATIQTKEISGSREIRKNIEYKKKKNGKS
ncbi:MAG: hypothetical protein LBJ72_07270 [Dysgonamonadaceae bacterium]|nr:hypothetical protein [Dysgonamonadaceae bacterium]